jgi:hypothetical protein
MTQYRQHGRADIGRPPWRSPNRVILTAKLPQHQISEKAGRLQRNFTIWVKHEQRAQIRIVVRDVTNVNAAIKQALKEAAERWACDPDTLNIHGIAEGDITDLDPESTSD